MSKVLSLSKPPGRHPEALMIWGATRPSSRKLFASFSNSPGTVSLVQTCSNRKVQGNYANTTFV